MSQDTRFEAYEKELHFGQIMLKRAKRRAAILESELATAHPFHTEFANMEEEYRSLQQEIAEFEKELVNAYHTLHKKDGSAS